jgi:ribosomal protein S18 acetylase RimI-like enzyme
MSATPTGGDAPPAPSLRPGTADDAAAAAGLHASRISEGFLAALGPGFLELLYHRIALDPGAFLIVAEESATVSGMIAGAVDVGGLYRRFIRHEGVRATTRALPTLVRNWRRVFETLRHGSEAASDAELLSVAVAPRCEGKGVGSRLVGEFQAELRRRRVDVADVVVGEANTSARALYERCGFVVAESFELHPGTTSIRMRWAASGTASDHRGEPSGPTR